MPAAGEELGADCYRVHQDPAQRRAELFAAGSQTRQRLPRRGNAVAVLALALVAGTAFEGGRVGVDAHWPICYDYKVSDPQLCPKRDEFGLPASGNEIETNCYHVEPWAETSPAPTCRNDGCLLNKTSACCCGASSTIPGFQNPNKPADKDTECTDNTYGTWNENGGAAGVCPQCSEGLGVSNGVGGNVIEAYGEGEYRDPSKQFDFQTFGHVFDIDFKLEICLEGIRQLWAKLEEAVNKECDVKSFFRMERCGNCWKAICEFHNQLHWTNDDGDGPTYLCMQDFFARRMECYANWYYKYCDCRQKVPTPVTWKDECVVVEFLKFDSGTGFYPMCTDAPRTARTSLLLAALLATGALLWPSLRS